MAKEHWLDPEDSKMSFIEIEHEFENISNNVAAMNENITRLTQIIEKKVDEIQTDVKDWRGDVDEWRKDIDFRMRDMSHCCVERQKILDTVVEHMRNDKPIDHYLGKWSLALVAFVATLCGSFLVNRILNIVGNR